MANDNPDISFLKVDVVNNDNLKYHFQIDSIPVVKFLKVEGGELKDLDEVVDPNVAEIKKKFSSHI